MMSEATEKKFRNIIRELGRLILAEVENRFTAPKPRSKAKKLDDGPQWLSAYLDARWFSDGEGFKAKIRVVKPNDASDGSIQLSYEIEDLLLEISSMRKEGSVTGWYGLKITVGSDGALTTDLDADPNCVVDPTWYHS
jgi:hypothetical protein